MSPWVRIARRLVYSAGMELKIARVELLNGATGETYQRLHSFMEGLGWNRHIYTNTLPRRGPIALPTAMYCVDSEYSSFTLAEGLIQLIQTNVWPKVTVLVMGVGQNWAIWES